MSDVATEDKDVELLERVSGCVFAGMTESDSIQFLASLSVSEYDRLIYLFSSDEESGLPHHIKKKLILILEKLRNAKRQGVAA